MAQFPWAQGSPSRQVLGFVKTGLPMETLLCETPGLSQSHSSKRVAWHSVSDSP